MHKKRGQPGRTKLGWGESTKEKRRVQNEVRGRLPERVVAKLDLKGC